jgi:cell division FtsZ-interacting protein ZapD
VRAHLRGHYTWCREHCLNFLTEPRIPLWTRVQTLQLLSTLSQPAGAEQCLNEADQIIDIFNPEQLQTKLLREDNRKMKADMMAWRVEHNLVGQDIEGVNDRGEAFKPEVDVESAGADDKVASILSPASSETD